MGFRGFLLAVADGIGGGPGGQEASRVALQALDDAAGVDVRDLARLVSAVAMANRQVFEAGQHGMEGMGTTLTAAVIFSDRLLLAHVGDSRAYQVLSDHVVRLTIDHSVAGEMERAGSITADEAAHHPRRNVLTRWVGSFDKVRIDVLDIAWNAESRLLLCTDGLTSVLNDEEISQTCRLTGGQALVDRLIDTALQRGGPDNITVVLADVVTEAGDGDGR